MMTSETCITCVAVCCSVLQCVAVCCSVLQCVAVCYSVLQCVYIILKSQRLNGGEWNLHSTIEILTRTFGHVPFDIFIYVSYL